jgi:hypothetical protein
MDVLGVERKQRNYFWDVLAYGTFLPPWVGENTSMSWLTT